MSNQHARRFSRRKFLEGLTLAGTAGLLGLHPRLVAAEPPPETTKIRLVKIPAMCLAPESYGQKTDLVISWRQCIKNGCPLPDAAETRFATSTTRD